MIRKRAGKDAAPTEGAEATAPPAPRNTTTLIAAAIIAVGLLGGGFFMGGKGGGATAEAASAPATPAHTEKGDHGPVQELEPITLNLADGRFLKVGLALQRVESEGGGHGGGEDLAPAKALDVAITLLGSYTMEQLSDPEARELVKKKLSSKVAEAYVDPTTHHSEVTKVYFTEFVMQ
ncbi:MAG TPA: flagellar basal body-associated FliL family protein [Egibacteraceae bacterium]|nr:flagellar basal body-associated FliL family protein [Egibacteraceae bacterium]